jgi:Tfp pilus assembly pilus retraction ATPase PilT
VVEDGDKQYILCLNCVNELIYKKDMEKYYCVKIDKRRKKAIENFENNYKTDSITKCIERNQLYVNETEDDYVLKQYAKKYCSYEEAEQSITEDFEIVSRL